MNKIDRIAKDKLWLFIWGFGILTVGMWNRIYLNDFAFRKVISGFFNTMLMASMTVVFTMLFSLVTANLILYLKKPGRKPFYTVLFFILHSIRSIPQIVGILFGSIWIAHLSSTGYAGGVFGVFLLTSMIVSLFIFQEVNELLLERVEYYRKLDFYSAMLVCGIKEFRIVNNDIFWKNSRVHILNKLISVFGMAVFLQCSVDFIISVGLSTSVSLVDFPPSLGTLLAHIDSKQDILAVGYTLTNPLYVKNLFFKHLQGVTVAFTMVFTLLSIYKISNGFAERHRL